MKFILKRKMEPFKVYIHFEIKPSIFWLPFLFKTEKKNKRIKRLFRNFGNLNAFF